MHGKTARNRVAGGLGLLTALIVACGGDPGGPRSGRVQVRLVLDLQALSPTTSIIPVAGLTIAISRIGDGAAAVVDTALALSPQAGAMDVVVSVPVEAESAMFSIVASIVTDADETVFMSAADTVTLSTNDPDQPLPVDVTFRFVWEAVDAGDFVTCALAAGGRAFCWGFSTFGQLGDGVIGSDTSTAPAPVLGGVRYTTISVGGFAACGIAENGQAHCWGTDLDGTLGDGLPAGPGHLRGEPGPVAGGQTWSSLTVGYHHACGIGTDGVPYCWGNNHLGQLGAESSDTCDIEACSATPIALTAVANVRQVSAGIGSTCVLDDDGTAYCSDFNDPTAGFLPSPAPGGASFASVTAGALYQCALHADQRGYCWGTSNFTGQLGLGGTVANTMPSPVLSLGPLRMITASSANAVLAHTCAVTVDDQAYCWGWGEHGQLGAPATRSCVFNTMVVSCVMEPLAVNTDLKFATVTVGYRHTCGMTTDRRLFCWGANDRAQLGNGTLMGSTSPVEVRPPS